MTITASIQGSFTLQISAEGGGAMQTQSFVVTQEPPISRTEYMKYLAIFLVGFFSPMLMASVPHSRFGYLPFACFVGVLAAGGTIALREFVPQNSELYRGYFYFLMSITSAVACSTFVMIVMNLVAYRCGVPRLRMFNDEGKALRVVRYTTWITNIRLSHQSDLFDEMQQKQYRSASYRLKSMQYEKMIEATEGINRLTGMDLVDNSHLNAKQARRRRRVIQKALIYTPSESFDPIYPPINYLIVVGISSVLLVTFCFIIVFLYDYLLKKINVFIGYLPNTSGANEVQLTLINRLIVLSLTTTINIIVRMFPQFAHLASINNAIENVDIVEYLNDLRSFIDAGLLRLQVAFWVAGSVSCIAFFATLVMTWLTIPTTIRKIRRGQLDVSCSIGSTEAYIGMHCLQLILMHQLVFWPLVIIAFLLSIEAFRLFLWDKLSVIILASIVSYFTQTLVQKILVTKFLTDGKWMLLRTELYQIWHFAGLILGVFSGLVKSAVRWGMSLGLVSLLFARLDQAIYPQLFASMDAGHNGFMSIVAVEAKNGNPIYIMFATWMILEARLRDEGEKRNDLLHMHDNVNKAFVMPVDDELFADDFDLSAVVKNASRILMRRLAVTSDDGNFAPVFVPLDLQKPIPPMTVVNLLPYRNRLQRLRQQRIQQRFWLFWLLTANPSLIAERKHNLYEDYNDDDSENRSKEVASRRSGDVDRPSVPCQEQQHLTAVASPGNIQYDKSFGSAEELKSV